jgi:large subunit ribosomal protein L21e
MAKRIGGLRRKSRSKMTRPAGEKGKISLSLFFQQPSVGDRVVLKVNPAYQKGMYMPRFHGLTGVVQGKKGACFEILIKDRSKEKTLVVHPVHFVKV